MWMIAGNVDEGDTPVFWSNIDGWVDRDDADIFTTAEKYGVRLPMAGRWVEV